MDAAVGNQALQRDASDFSANRVVARDDHRFGRVVDDYIDAGRGFDRADIAPLAPDYPPFHLVGRQRDYRNRPFGDEFAREPLDCDGDDSLGPPISLLARFFLDHSYMARRFMPRLSDHLVDQRAFGLFAGEPGDRFQPGARFFDQRLAFGFFIADRFFAIAHRLIAPIEFSLATFEGFLAFFESLLARFQLVFQRRQFAPPFAQLALRFVARGDDHVFGLEFRFLD